MTALKSLFGKECPGDGCTGCMYCWTDNGGTLDEVAPIEDGVYSDPSKSSKIDGDLDG